MSSQDSGGVDVPPKYCLVCCSSVDDCYNPSPVDVAFYLRAICDIIGLNTLETEMILGKHEDVNEQINFCKKCRRNLKRFREIETQLQCLTVQMSKIKDTLSKDFCTETDLRFEDTCHLRTILANEYDTRNIPKLILVNPESTLGVDYSTSIVSLSPLVDEISYDQNSGPEISDEYTLKPCRVKLERVDDIESCQSYYDDQETRKIRFQKLIERQEAKLTGTTGRHRSRKTRNILRREMAPIGGKIQSNSAKARIKCPQCPQHRHTEEMLRFHVRRMHENKMAMYNCFNCNVEYWLLKDLRNHESETGHRTPVSRIPGTRKKKTNQKSPKPKKMAGKTILASDLKCPQCPQHRHSEELLRFHVRRIHEHKTAMYNCFNCEAEFPLLIQLRNHETETGHHTPMTQLVGQVKRTKRDRDNTVKKVKNLGSFKCPHCCKRRNTEEFVRFHVRRNHEKKIPYNCFSCDAEFELLYKLRYHEEETGHSTPNSQICNPVKKKINPDSEGNSVKNRQKFRITGGFKCPHCRECRLSQEFIRFHIRKKHESKVPYNCFSCDEEFAEISKLRSHEAKTGHHTPRPNSNLEKIECQNCRREFLRPSYDAHLERQGGVCQRQLPPLPLNGVYDKSQKKSQRYICGDCGKKFRFPHHLEIHVRGTHTDGFAFMCEYCSKPFKTKKSLTQHQLQIHLEHVLASKAQGDADVVLAKVEKRRCDICSITLSSIQAKLAHDKKHTTDYKYQCELCGKGWMTLASLRDHKKTHAAEKKYKCNICSHGFDRPNKLNFHIQSKHGIGNVEKKFKCDRCEKSFRDNQKKNRHIKLMHSNQKKGQSTIPLDFSCDICSYNCAIREYLIVHSRTKKHLQNIKDRGLSDAKSGLRFPDPLYKASGEHVNI